MKEMHKPYWPHRPGGKQLVMRDWCLAIGLIVVAALLVFAGAPAKAAETDGHPGFINAGWGWGGVVGGVVGCMMFGCGPDYDRDHDWGDHDHGGWDHDHGDRDHGDHDHGGGDHSGGHEGHGGRH